jgi:hypothetical protein
MVIILDTPFGLGDLSDEKFPHVYVTNLMINGPAQTVTVVAEVGIVQADGSWKGAPVNTSFQVNITGQDLLPFFTQKPGDLETSLWDQVESLVYAQVQQIRPRFAGKLGSGIVEPASAVPPTTDPTVTNAVA